MKPNRTARLISAIALVATLAFAATAGAEHHEAAPTRTDIEPIPWDPAKMTELTATLAQQLRDVQNAFRKSPAMTMTGTTKQRTAEMLLDTLRQLSRRGRNLASNVAAGRGMEETLNIARNIGTLLRDAQMRGRRVMSNEWVEERVRPAMETLNQIAPFYGVSQLYDVETGELLPMPSS